MSVKPKYAEYKKGYYKNRYHNDPEYRKKVIDRSKRYQAANRERLIVYKREHYRLNKDTINSKRRAYNISTSRIYIVPEGYMSAKRTFEVMKLSRERVRQIRAEKRIVFKKLGTRTFVYLEKSIRGYMGVTNEHR